MNFTISFNDWGHIWSGIKSLQSKLKRHGGWGWCTEWGQMIQIEGKIFKRIVTFIQKGNGVHEKQRNKRPKEKVRAAVSWELSFMIVLSRMHGLKNKENSTGKPPKSNRQK